MSRKSGRELLDPKKRGERIQARRDRKLRALEEEMHQRWRDGVDPVAEDATPIESLVRQLRLIAIQPGPRRRDRGMPERTTPCVVKGYTGRIPRQKPSTNRPKSRTERRSV